RAGAKGRTEVPARARERAPFLLLRRMAERRLEERRLIHIVGAGQKIRGRDHVTRPCVGKSRQRSKEGLRPLTVRRVLRAQPQPRAWLIVDPDDGLIAERLFDWTYELIVVGETGAVESRRRPPIENGEPGRIETVLWNPAEDA